MNSVTCRRRLVLLQNDVASYIGVSLFIIQCLRSCLLFHMHKVQLMYKRTASLGRRHSQGTKKNRAYKIYNY